ncbi:recombinase family protein [Pseudonocardia ailaonensis]|uniref:Recombinase family protein n=1 Tax=Pseudonocardia ailaonensis TaxID=367279 RepID=A0ABN2NP93_9PSEU
MPRKAIVYARISRDRTGGGLGVDRQLADCRELAARLDWQIAAERTDNDLSAYSGKPRPGYRQLLADLERGLATGVLVWHTDRLHRSPAELEQYIAICDPLGVVTHTVQAGVLDLATPSGRMVARQLGAVARFESEHKAERVRRARIQMAEEGKWGGGTRPFGYQAGGVELVPDEAAAIVRATETILSGGSLRSVVIALNEGGFITTKGKLPWTPGAARDMLTRPRNAGLVSHRGKIVGPGQWPALVPEEQWRTVVQILKNPARRTSPGNYARWLGSGLYRCGIEGCGGPLTVGTSGQKRHPSYMCRKREAGASRHVSRVATTLDAYVSAVIVERLKQDDARDLIRSLDVEADTTELHAEADRIRRRLEQVGQEFAEDDEMDVVSFRSATKRLRERLTGLENELAVAGHRNPLVGVADAVDVQSAWDELDDLARKRAILDALMTVTVQPAPRGRRPDGSYFDPKYVLIDWKVD